MQNQAIDGIITADTITTADQKMSSSFGINPGDDNKDFINENDVKSIKTKKKQYRIIQNSIKIV